MLLLKIIRKSSLLLFTLAIALSPLLVMSKPADAYTGNFAFPVLGGGSYSNDYYAPRSNPTGIHHAIDIMAGKHTPLLAVAHGTVVFAPVPQPSYGYIVTIRDDENFEYNYIHINNDTPGTDDGNGGPMNAYAPYIKSGNRVQRGQIIGYLGDSGNAENTVPHLHFEIEDPDGNYVNPYNKLNQAIRFSSPTDPPIQDFETLPYSKSKTPLNVAVGNTDAGSSVETVTGPGPGSDRGSRVKLFDDDDTPLLGFDAYVGTNAGVDVALGDMDGNNIDEIVTAPGAGIEPRVKYFDASDPSIVEGFLAYPADFQYGMRVASGDLDDDGEDEIVVAAGRGSKPSIKIFKSDGVEVRNFFAFAETMRSGMDVAVGNMDDDDEEEIIVVPSHGDAQLVRIYEPDGTFVREFMAYEKTSVGEGVRLDAGNVRQSSDTDEIVTVPEDAGVPGVRLYSNTGNLLSNQSPIEHWWIGYYDVAAGNDRAIFGMGANRRASFMEEF